ncbi:MAG: SsrA-binding protein SmpB, partial [Gemmatimonadota bacterium]
MARSAGGQKVVIRNRKARHEFEILDELETGLVLRGAEVKSLRAGKANFTDAYARIADGELWLHNLHIPPYESAHGFETLDPVRPRKLLLHRRELERLRSKVAERGFALIPLDIHFRRGFAKVTLALARGKKLHDKRQALKRADMKREVDRALGT